MTAIDTNRTALLVMDFQTSILAMLGDKAAPVLERTAGVIAAARNAKVQSIYVVVGFRPGYPEINPRTSGTFAQVAQSGRFATTSPGSDIAPEVAPQDGDAIVWKHRVSAFTGTDLDMILRANGIEALILCGLSTSGVTLSTVRHAMDADYKQFVVKDCCADGDDEVHRVLTEKIFMRHTTVVTASEIIAGLLAG